MTWFLIAIWAPLLWAFSNHIDKYLITRYGEDKGIKGLITFSSLCSVFILLIAFYVSKGDVFVFKNIQILELFISGFLYSIAILAYLSALSYSDTSNTTPVFQLIPVFAFILGYLFLGESMTTHQAVGGLIVILGAILILVDFKNRKINKNGLILMAVSSLIFAIYQLLFKAGSSDLYWPSIFWQAVGTFASGLVFLSLKKYRTEFKSIINTKNYTIVMWSLLVEISTMGGNMLVSKAITIAPSTALVLLVEAIQPICVLGLAIIFTLFLPWFAKEEIDLKILSQKFIAIIIIIIGGSFLF